MTSWLNLMADERIADNSEVVAPNGEKVTMGQVREAWLSRQADIEKKEANIRQAQGELANVFSILQNEKVAIEAAREEIRNRSGEIEARGGDVDDTGAKFFNGLQEEVKSIKQSLAESHKTAVEMADIYLDDVWNREYEKYKDDLPAGISRNDVLKYAMQQGIKDRRGIVDIGAALSRITEPKTRDRAIKEAEDRGARRKEEEMLLRSVGSPSAFQTRDTGATGEAKKYSNLDSAFDAAAKDASIFFPEQVQ